MGKGAREERHEKRRDEEGMREKLGGIKMEGRE